MKGDWFVHIEKGISIHLIEYILIYHYGYMYYNDNDPHQDTQYKLSDLSDGHFHFHMYGHSKNKKYIAPVYNPIDFHGDYFFDEVNHTCLMGSKLLRNYKINKIKKQLKN